METHISRMLGSISAKNILFSSPGFLPASAYPLYHSLPAVLRPAAFASVLEHHFAVRTRSCLFAQLPLGRSRPGPIPSTSPPAACSLLSLTAPSIRLARRPTARRPGSGRGLRSPTCRSSAGTSSPMRCSRRQTIFVSIKKVASVDILVRDG